MENMTLDFAKDIAKFAESLVKNEYGDNPFSVAVVDKDGFTVLYQKEDGAKLLTIALTPAKAYTAVRMGQPTADFLARLQREHLEIVISQMRSLSPCLAEYLLKIQPVR